MFYYDMIFLQCYLSPNMFGNVIHAFTVFFLARKMTFAISKLTKYQWRSSPLADSHDVNLVTHLNMRYGRDHKRQHVYRLIMGIWTSVVKHWGSRCLHNSAGLITRIWCKLVEYPGYFHTYVCLVSLFRWNLLFIGTVFKIRILIYWTFGSAI